jgi:hypothetical protein
MTHVLIRSSSDQPDTQQQQQLLLRLLQRLQMSTA